MNKFNWTTNITVHRCQPLARVTPCWCGVVWLPCFAKDTHGAVFYFIIDSNHEYLGKHYTKNETEVMLRNKGYIFDKITKCDYPHAHGLYYKAGCQYAIVEYGVSCIGCFCQACSWGTGETACEVNHYKRG